KSASGCHLSMQPASASPPPHPPPPAGGGGRVTPGETLPPQRGGGGATPGAGGGGGRQPPPGRTTAPPPRGSRRSPALAEVRPFLHPATLRDLLGQALLDAPMFMTRWRWVAGVALALPRFRGGKKVPAPLARMDAEDLIAAIFPDQMACAENLVGAREIPDHPLVHQTIEDC